ncbi:hypothetical protein H4S08_004674 [Coemansia sp. RSA 1365]|nr:hypothetical protein H4S08_004674 [Coemansia sp. RSA 1365]
MTLSKDTSATIATDFGVVVDNVPSDANVTEDVDWSLIRIFTENHKGASQYNNDTYGAQVDRTLICKALFGISAQVVRVCMPNGFGKSYNLNTIMRFFNVLTKHDMPNSKIRYSYNGILDEYNVHFDAKTAHNSRESSQKMSLLFQEAPIFFEKHFCRYPVILIRFDFRRILYQTILCSAGFWAKGLDREGLTENQIEMVAAFEALYEKLRNFAYNNIELNTDHDAILFSLFSSLSSMLVNIYQQRYIILVDNYDYLLVALNNMEWADNARNLYIGFLSHMFTDNANLQKALLVGTYIIPLSAGKYDLALDNIFTISHTAYHCSTENVTKPSPHMSYDAVLESMFGFNTQETVEFIKCKMFQYPALKDTVEYTLEKVMPYFGKNVSVTGRMCCGLYEAVFYADHRDKSGSVDKAIAAYSKVPKIHATIKAVARMHRNDMLLLSTRLIHGYDNNKHCCYIWPSLQEAQLASHGIEDKTRNFVLYEFSLLGAHDGQFDMNSVVTLLLHIGYLTIGAGNTIRIPNGHLRKTWNAIRLFALFGTYNQVQQDVERHRLIDSLFERDIGPLCQEFQHVLVHQQNNNDLYSDHTKLELACKYIIGKIDSQWHYSNQPTVLEYSQSFLSQPQTDKFLSWTITMKPFGRYTQKLVLVFSFVYITEQDLKDSETTPAHLASKALATINDKEYIQQVSKNEVRLYFGIAYGQNNLAIEKKTLTNIW